MVDDCLLHVQAQQHCTSPVIVFKYQAAPVSPGESSALEVAGDNELDPDDEQGKWAASNNLRWVNIIKGLNKNQSNSIGCVFSRYMRQPPSSLIILQSYE